MPPILRSILSIIAGFVAMSFIVGVMTVLAVVMMHQKSGQPTGGYLVINVLYSFFAAAAGGAVAALIAGRKPLEHGCILAGIMLAAGIASYRHYTGQQPLWYQWMMMIVPPLCAVAGSAIVARSAPSASQI